MILMHYARQPITFDPARTYTQGRPCAYGKPEGFWVSVQGEDDWPSWCREENCLVHRLTAAHTVTLRTTANIHVIDNVHRLDLFTALYAVQPERDRGFSWSTDARNRWPIDWREVAKDYDGLIIAPYLWPRRTVEWYYGWDCASGCIWNLDAIESVELATTQVNA